MEPQIQVLAEKVLASGYRPDCILYIERAGRIPGVLLARRLGCVAVPATASRTGRSLKTRFRHLLRLLPTSAKNLLRRLELAVGVQESSPQRNVSIPKRILEFERILIVDDAIDTGQSVLQVKAAVEALHTSPPPSIKVAVITTTASRGRESVLQPDFALFRRTIVHFPWSSDSPEYDEFLRLYDQLGGPV